MSLYIRACSEFVFIFFCVFVLCAVRLTFSRSLTLSGGLFLWVWGRRRSTCGVPHIFIMIAKRRCERVSVCVCATAKMGPPFGECERVCVLECVWSCALQPGGWGRRRREGWESLKKCARTCGACQLIPSTSSTASQRNRNHACPTRPLPHCACHTQCEG